MPNLWSTLTKELTIWQQRWILGGLAAGVLLAVALFGPTKSPSERPASLASPTTPLQGRIKAELEQAGEAKKVDAALPDQDREADIGVITTIVGPGTSWPCASSKVALKELMKWQKAMLDEHAPDSVMNNLADTLIRTRSIMVAPRDRVKVLQKEPGIRKVRVIEHKGTYGAAYMTATAQGCWVASGAVTR